MDSHITDDIIRMTLEMRAGEYRNDIKFAAAFRRFDLIRLSLLNGIQDQNGHGGVYHPNIAPHMAVHPRYAAYVDHFALLYRVYLEDLPPQVVYAFTTSHGWPEYSMVVDQRSIQPSRRARDHYRVAPTESELGVEPTLYVLQVPLRLSSDRTNRSVPQLFNVRAEVYSRFVVFNIY